MTDDSWVDLALEDFYEDQVTGGQPDVDLDDYIDPEDDSEAEE